MRRKRRKLWILAFVALLCAFLFIRIRSQLQPLIKELAATQMDSVISSLMNSAINEQIASGEINYDRMIFFEKDLDGNITALRTNMSETNHLKTQVLERINERLAQLTTEELGIPLGNVLMPEFFSGQGPEIPIQLLSVGTSSAEFSNEFSEAGINQTLHRVLLTAIVNCTVLVPGDTTTIQVRTEVVVAETILVGNVPENYVTIKDQMQN